MNELGLLSQLACISGVSGGSIAAAQVGVAWKKLAFDAATGVGDATAFKTGVVDPLMTFCSKTIDIPAAIDALVNPFKPGSQALIESLQKDLLGDAKLDDLPGLSEDGIRFVFNATNLQTGVRFWMSREDLGDYQIGYTTQTSDVSVAAAVAASAAFPPVFAPLEFRLPAGPYKPCQSATNGHAMGDHVNDPTYHQVAQLCDGGTYDNLGLQTIWAESYATLWVSDASSTFVPYTNYLAQSHWYQPHMLVTLLRVIDTMMRAGEARHRSDLIEKLQAGPLTGAYWGTSTKLSPKTPAQALPLDQKKVEKLAQLDTQLRDFGEPIRKQLINWGYAIADRQIRMWSKGPWPNGSLPAKWPYADEAIG